HCLRDALPIWNRTGMACHPRDLDPVLDEPLHIGHNPDCNTLVLQNRPLLDMKLDIGMVVCRNFTVQQLDAGSAQAFDRLLQRRLDRLSLRVCDHKRIRQWKMLRMDRGSHGGGIEPGSLLIAPDGDFNRQECAVSLPEYDLDAFK